MMGSTHILTAAGSSAVAVTITDPEPVDAAIFVAAAIGTARLPDIDLKIPFLEHRGPLTHSPWWASMWTILVMVAAAFAVDDTHVAAVIGLGFACGILTHQLLGDALTLSGIPLLWPFDRDRHGRTRDRHLLPEPMRIRTDGPMELVFGTLLVGAVGYYLWSTYAPAT